MKSPECGAQSAVQSAMCELTAQILKSVPLAVGDTPLLKVAVVNDVPAYRTIVAQIQLLDDGFNSPLPFGPDDIQWWLQTEPVQWAMEHTVRPLEFVQQTDLVRLIRMCVLVAYFPGPLHTFWNLKWSNTVQQQGALW